MAEAPLPARDWFEEAPVGFLVTGAGGRIVQANPALLAWTGYGPRELLDRPWTEALLTPSARVLAQTHILPLLASEGRVEKLILDLLGAGGRRVHVVARIDRLPDGACRFTFVEAPDRRAWEEQLLKANRAAEDALQDLRELNQDLERRVAERTADLDAYARSVAHDLRGPLQAILALGQALEASAGPSLAPADARKLDTLIQSAQSMETLISGLLQLARASGTPLELSHVDLSAMASRICGELRAANPDRRVQVNVAPGLATLGDAALLEVVLRNLLGNAWKYTSATEEARIAFEQEADCGFCVRDNGAGFDMAVSDRLFQPFQRLHDAQSFPGIGLGLVAAKRIIERHGGRLRVVAAPGLGAAFSFTLGPEGSEWA